MLTAPPRLCVLACATLLATPVAATTLQCGLFTADDGSRHMRILSERQGEQVQLHGAPEPFALQRIDGRLQQVDLRYGVRSAVDVHAGGQEFTLGNTTYSLQAPAACIAVAPPAAGSCLADAAACLERRHELKPAALQAGCGEGVPGLCVQLANLWQDQARAAADQRLDAPDAMFLAAASRLDLPAPCRDGGLSKEAPECVAAIKAEPALAQELTRIAIGVVTGSVVAAVAANPNPSVLPAAQRQTLLQLCRDVPHGDFCARVATTAWEALDPLPAVQALELACAPGGDRSACERLPALKSLGASLVPQPATSLPSGRYRSDGGMISELDFDEAGEVTLVMGPPLHARIESGTIHIRHDKGGDFLLRPLPGGQLLGLDQWTRYQVFTRMDEDASPTGTAPAQ